VQPDLSAPGIDIIASWTMLTSPTGNTNDNRRVMYNIISGTSMACPHASGAAAYLKSVHRDWSPAMIMSALVTTGTVPISQSEVFDDLWRIAMSN
jgi:subtilisin family serine protease